MFEDKSITIAEHNLESNVKKMINAKEKLKNYRRFLNQSVTNNVLTHSNNPSPRYYQSHKSAISQTPRPPKHNLQYNS